jgi:hypothetical protein
LTIAPGAFPAVFGIRYAVEDVILPPAIFLVSANNGTTCKSYHNVGSNYGIPYAVKELLFNITSPTNPKRFMILLFVEFQPVIVNDVFDVTDTRAVVGLNEKFKFPGNGPAELIKLLRSIIISDISV